MKRQALKRQANGSYITTYRGSVIQVLDHYDGAHGREWTFTLNGHYASDTWRTKEAAYACARRTVDATASDYENGCSN